MDDQSVVEGWTREIKRRSALLDWSSMEGEERAFLLLRLNDAALSRLPPLGAATMRSLDQALRHHATGLGVDDDDLAAAQRQRRETRDIINWANEMGDSPGQ